MRRHAILVLLFLGCAVVLGACKSAQERAQEHYQQGLRELAIGDSAAAVVEFRRAVDLDRDNPRLQMSYADLLRRIGDLSEAAAVYRRMLIGDPANVRANRILAEIALRRDDFSAAASYAGAALAVRPLDPGAHAVRLSLDYRVALGAHDEAARQTAAARARALLVRAPATPLAWQLVIDDRSRAADWPGALKLVDRAIAANPERRDFYVLRVAILSRLDRSAAVEAQLRAMVTRFPEDRALPMTLSRWLSAQGRVDDAERFLRDRIEPGKPSLPARLEFVQFLLKQRGAPAAQRALDDMLATATGATRRAILQLQAWVRFNGGEPAPAIAALEGLILDTPEGPARDEIRVLLAQMKAQIGDAEGARALVAAVLRHDPNQLGAIKLRAADLIAADRSKEALVLLRQAQSVAPQDPTISILMARAYGRINTPNMRSEMLARAVQQSNYAPAEALLFARRLIEKHKFSEAQQVLREALQLAPNDPGLRMQMGELHIAQQDWSAARADLAALRISFDPTARTAAKRLQAMITAAEQHGDAAIAYLDEILVRQGAKPDPEVAAIRAEMLSGHLREALHIARTLAARAPDSEASTVILAAVLQENGRDREAETRLRDFIGRNPRSVPAWSALYRLKMSQGDPGGAAAVLQIALRAVPGSRRLRWIEAGAYERQGEFEAAIAIYRALYADDPSSEVLANNLASLLAEHRDDAKSLAEAERIAEPLRDSLLPAFQDTYGWIAYRRGDLPRARRYLEAAAARLPDSSAIQYHLAMVDLAQDRPDPAKNRLERALENVGPRTPVALGRKITEALSRLSHAAPAVGQTASPAPHFSAAQADVPAAVELEPAPQVPHVPLPRPSP